MPNLDQVRKAEERRKAREDAKKQHQADAIQQDQDLAQLSEEQSQPGEDGVVPIKAAKAPPPVDRRATAAQRLKAHEKQAQLDGEMVPKPLDEIDLAYYRDNNLPVPLPILNAMAAKASEGIKNDAREVAKLVGEKTFAELSGRAPERSRYSRQRKVSRALAEAAKLKPKE